MVAFQTLINTVNNKFKTSSLSLKFGVYSRKFIIGLSWLHASYFRDANISWKSVELAVNRILSQQKARGGLDTILKLKDMRTCIYSVLAGESPTVKGYKAYKSGLPKLFGGEMNKAFTTRSEAGIRLILTIFQYSRIIPEHKKVDYSPIFQGPRADFSHILERFSSRIPTIMRGLSLRPVDVKWSELHMPFSSGPSGPALLCAPNIMGVALKRFFRSFLALDLNGPYEYFSRVAPYNHLWPDFQSPRFKDILRRLSIVKDVDGKSRIIAILDYWSQDFLKPIHDALMRVLSRLGPMDVTYGQSIEPFGSPSHKYYSFDLTGATDRFPIQFISSVLRELMDKGPGFVPAWEDIMIGEPFFVKNGKSVKYGTGQPMGGYSSWAGFSVTHHFFVQFCALECGYTLPFVEYRLLGDDIVIRHNKVAEKYRELMTSIGVEIQPSKSIVSDTSFEFCKRFFLNEVEVTSFPLAGLVNTYSKWTELLHVLHESARRGYPKWQTFGFDHIKNLYLALSERHPGAWSFRYTKDYIRRLNRKILMLQWVHDRMVDNPLYERIMQDFKFDIYPPSARRKTLMSQCLREAKMDNQTQALFAQLEIVESVNKYLVNYEGQSEYVKLSNPVMMVLQDQFARINLHVDTFNEAWNASDERVLYEIPMISETNPEFLDTRRRHLRVMAMTQTFCMKAISNFKFELETSSRSFRSRGRRPQFDF